MLAGRQGRRWKRSPRWNAVQSKAELTVDAPRDQLVQLYMDYANWSQRFPDAVRGVRLVRRNGDRIVVEVDHGDGTALNVIKRLSEYEIEVEEHERRYDIKVFNRFERAGDATRCVIVTDVRLKGAYALVAPLIARAVQRRVERLFVEPVRAAMDGRLIA